MPTPAQAPPEDLRPTIAAMGLSGVIVRFSDRLNEAANRAALAFRAEVECARLAGVAETASSLGSVFLRYDPLVTDAGTLGEALAPLVAGRDWYAAALPQGRRRWTVPAVFDGPQLEEAAALAGLAPEAAVADLVATKVRVLAIGFAPGLPYMGTLAPHWDIPRQTALTPTAPAGALVVAVRQIIIFPTPTPTGWRQVGRTAFRAFRPGSPEPFPLSAGDEVRFRAVAADEFERLAASDPGDGGAIFEVIP